MVEMSEQLLRAALEAAPEGVVLCETRGADHPVVYANRAFLRMTGYSGAELLGQDLRRLQGSDHDQEGRTQLRAALERGAGCRVLLRNYRKDGTQLWVELQVQPLETDGAAATHFIALARELDERQRAGPQSAAGLATWLREDRLSGLCSRAYFEQLLERDWQIGLRENRALTLLAFDIDELGAYNETYGRAAGDGCIRRVAGVIGASFKRGADLVARWQGGCILALVRSSDPATVASFAGAVAQKVLDQHIHHPRARRQKFICVSVGGVTRTPDGARSPSTLVHAALRALEKAKRDRHTRVAIAGPSEID